MGKNYHGLELHTTLCFTPFSCFWALQKRYNRCIRYPVICMTNMVWKDGAGLNLEFLGTRLKTLTTGTCTMENLQNTS